MRFITFLKHTHPESYSSFVRLALSNFSFTDADAEKLLKAPGQEERVQSYLSASSYIKAHNESKKDPKSVVGGVVALIGEEYGTMVIEDAIIEFSRQVISKQVKADDNTLEVAKSIDQFITDIGNDFLAKNNLSIILSSQEPDRELTQKDIDEFETHYITRLNK